jgi:hypothetical protein
MRPNPYIWIHSDCALTDIRVVGLGLAMEAPGESKQDSESEGRRFKSSPRHQRGTCNKGKGGPQRRQIQRANADDDGKAPMSYITGCLELGFANSTNPRSTGGSETGLTVASVRAMERGDLPRPSSTTTRLAARCSSRRCSGSASASGSRLQIVHSA